jgi:hypothetical protein
MPQPPAYAPIELLRLWWEESRRDYIPCWAYTADGYTCRAPATVVDRQRGYMVCAAHAPEDGRREEAP